MRCQLLGRSCKPQVVRECSKLIAGAYVGGWERVAGLSSKQYQLFLRLCPPMLVCCAGSLAHCARNHSKFTIVLVGRCVAVLVWSLLLDARSAFADNFWPPENFLGVIDLSTRHLIVDGEYGSVNNIGVDARYVVSGKVGDIGTLLFQPFVQIVDGAGPERNDFQWRMTNFNLRAFGHGRFNVRVGHFELPFGLEQVIDTNGTLEQLQNDKALGLKTDWGASVNGVLPRVEYELAFMIGGSESLSTDANGYVVGRIATLSDRSFWIGVSGLNGELETPSGTQQRSQMGVDLGWRLADGFSVLAEYAGGDRADETADQLLGQLEWTNRREQLRVYLQFRRERIAQVRARNLTAGLKFEPNNNLIVSAQLGLDLTRSGELVNQEIFSTQLRYRW